MKAKVSFDGGIDRDSAPHRIAANRPRQAVNFAWQAEDGQDHVLVNIRGNEEQFSLSPGFLPMGANEINGVTYIVSFNEATGEGEIGTYPSPAINGLGGFEHVYRPLQNWTGAIDPADPLAVRTAFRTTQFNFAEDRQCEVELSIRFDGSVNIYIADWRNPLRVVNSGFHSTSGVYNSGLYWVNGFSQGTDAFFESCPHAIFQSMVLQEGGAWLAGNVILYMRYKTLTLDSTSFISESAVVPIFVDGLAGGVTTDGASEDANTGKAIQVTLTGLDQFFAYVEIGFVRWTGSSFVTKLVDVLYPITGTSMTITVTGAETLIDLTADEIIGRKSLDDSPRSITQFDRRLWGANWRSSIPESDEFESFAQQFLIKPCDPDEQHEMHDGDFVDNGSTNLAYKDWTRVRDYVGYFRSEPYAFAIAFVLKNGKETRPYPIRGYDAWLDPTATVQNIKGILRMPSNMNQYYAFMRDRGLGNGQDFQVLGVKLDVSGVTVSQFIQDNVCGLYLMRAPRKAQMVAQGHVSDCYTPLPSDPWALGGLAPSQMTSFCIPEFRVGLSDPPEVSFDAPWIEVDAGGGGFITSSRDNWSFVSRRPHRFGLFSSDHFFDRGFTDGRYTIIIQGRSVLNAFKMSADDSRIPHWRWEQSTFSPGQDWFDDTNYGSAMLYNVREAEFNEVPGTGFASRFAEGTSSNASAGYSIFARAEWPFDTSIHSRDMRQRAYIGIKTDDTGSNGDFDTYLSEGNNDSVAHVNVYRTDPTQQDISSIYDPRREFYSRVSGFIALSDIGSIGSTVFYRGDCFISRCYHRSLCSAHERDNEDATGGRYYRYGNIAGLSQEMRMNTAMRRSADGDPYYPESTGASGYSSVAADYGDRSESAALNLGYNKVLGLYARLGFDSFMPGLANEFLVRVRYTPEHLEGSFADAYRRWDLAAYVDFDRRMGQIVRISSENGKLTSVQERGIIAHIVNERALVGDGSGGNLVIGEGDVLSDNFMVISDQHGSQHQWSIVKSVLGLYGYDQQQRAFWSVMGGQFKEMDTVLGFKADAFRVSELISDHSDILHGYPDAPVHIGGVVGWHDRKRKTVGWSFVIPGTDCPIAFETLCINERKNAYSGLRTHHSPFYLLIAEDLFSVSPAGMPWSDPQGGAAASFWIHDSENVPRTSFHGGDPYSMLSFIFNQPMGDSKIFDAFSLIVPGAAPDSMIVRTDHQLCTLNPFISNEAWKRPEYKEQEWHVPFPRADAVAGGQDLGIASYLRGNWCNVEIEYATGEEVVAMGAAAEVRQTHN
jgi:hypothetical protein